MGLRATGIVIAIALLLPAWASGQGKVPPAAAPTKEKTEAKLHYDQGTVHFNRDGWPQAIEEFKAAYRTFPDPTLLYNIAQCHRKMGNPTEALNFYKKYLRERPDAPNRNEVEKRIDELQAVLAAQPKSHEPPPVLVAPSPAATASASGTAAPAETSAPAASNGVPAEPALGARSSAEREPKTDPMLGSAARPVEPSAASLPAGADVTASAPAASDGTASKSIVKTWWFWTAVGTAVAAGTVLAVLSLSSSSPSHYQGNLDPPVLTVPR